MLRFKQITNEFGKKRDSAMTEKLKVVLSEFNPESTTFNLTRVQLSDHIDVVVNQVEWSEMSI